MRIGTRAGGVVLAMALLVAGGCSNDDDKDSDAASPSTSATGPASDSSVTTGTPSGDPSTGDGKCGVHTEDGVQLRTFCGKASASLTLAGQEHAFSGGECETTGEYVSVNIGTIVLGAGDKATEIKAKTAYFGLNLGRTPADDASKPAADKDGTYTTAVAGNDHGLELTAFGVKVALTGGRTAGTISGDSAGGPVTGRFSCV